MSINTIFAIIGAVFLGGTIALLITYIKYDESLVSYPGWRILLHLGLMFCCAISIASLILAYSARECPNCDNIAPSNYCEECGYQVRAMEYPKNLFCSGCGADINTDANFCRRCGKELTGTVSDKP